MLGFRRALGEIRWFLGQVPKLWPEAGKDAPHRASVDSAAFRDPVPGRIARIPPNESDSPRGRTD